MTIEYINQIIGCKIYFTLDEINDYNYWLCNRNSEKSHIDQIKYQKGLDVACLIAANFRKIDDKK